ncbi:hypothetical protein CSKR_104127 [Clonorchis sinensis]|uniref:G-protein coupled receptors family 1 profile domain-containing protein n=1 Tax=Clonorchis sinensis TaxID=79923 RepID=A0A3R7JI22_CLOSI|nr:hypothetical protein CSKR_104127 [Clonorchis sinensis]
MWSRQENWCGIHHWQRRVDTIKDISFSIPFILSKPLINMTKPVIHISGGHQPYPDVTPNFKLTVSVNSSEEIHYFKSSANTDPNLLSACRFPVGIVLTLLLALLALVANFGLLYLTRLTKPASQGKNSSFSISGPATTYYWSGRMSANSAQLRERVNLRRMFSCITPRKLQETATLDMQLDESTPVGLPIRKCASSVSITRVGMPITPTNPLTPRSRRHQRYVRGIFGLSISNITVSFSLLLWCICTFLDRIYFIPWIALLLVANSAIADIAQSLEISAVLWIALERTLGIHWPRERRPSNCTPDQTPQPNWRTKFKLLVCGTTQVRHAFCNQSYTSRSDSKHDNADTVCYPTRNSSVFQFTNRKLWSMTLLKKVKSFIRLVLSLIPFTLFVLASVPSLISFVQQIQMVENQLQDSRVYYFSPDIMTSEARLLHLHGGTNRSRQKAKLITVIYYTNTIVSSLVIGQFLAPLAILITTNLLIYKKVAARDKRFFSRQSSNTSKSSFVSGSSVTVVGPSSAKKGLLMNGTTGTVPLLRVLESSNQDLRVEEAESIQDKSALTDQETPKRNLLFVPELPVKESLSCSTKSCNGRSLINQRRRSTSELCEGVESDANIARTEFKNNCNRKMSFGTPQIRRKSTNDVFVSVFHSRNADGAGRPGEEPLLLQMLRRQHRRTLRILIILLLGFVMCRAPRAIVLMIGWLQSPYLCSDLFGAYTWLWYTTLWSQTSAVLDTIVYGFWGNRNCRIHLSRWCSNHSFRLLCTR